MFNCLEKIKNQLLELAPSVKIGLENGIKNAKSVPFIRIVSFNDEVAGYNALDLNFNIYDQVRIDTFFEEEHEITR